MITIDFGSRGPAQHAMTTFVFSSSAGGAAPTPPVVAVVNSSIDQWFAVDYRARNKRRKLTPVEWAWLQEVLKVWKRSERQAKRDMREHRRLEQIFSKGLTPPRRRTPKDLYAGLVSARRNG